MNLFEPEADVSRQIRLSEQMRPRKLYEVIGQEHLIGEGKPLTLLSKAKWPANVILWGPPGVGKTTIARLLYPNRKMVQLSAVLDGIGELKRALAECEAAQETTLFFIDEIHRWNKSQQDSLLPHLENGRIVLIGATTENPSFSLIAPLLSRSKVFVLNALKENELQTILERALLRLEGEYYVTPEALRFLVNDAGGDARRALLSLELACSLGRRVDVPMLETVLSKKQMHHDRSGESHYDLISAFIKSMRGSDPDAAVYYLARMLEAGEDPKFLCRRMIIFASEDVGLGDPRALPLAIAAAEAFDRIGAAEGWIPLSQAVIYLALAPKSNSTYLAYKKAKEVIATTAALPVPLHLRNARAGLLKELGYAKGYQYAHDSNEGQIIHSHLPEEISRQVFYEPKNRGFESAIFDRKKNSSKANKV